MPNDMARAIADAERERDLLRASVDLALPCVRNALECAERAVQLAERELRDALHHLTQDNPMRASDSLASLAAIARTPSYKVFLCPEHGIVTPREAGLDIACPVCLTDVMPPICVAEVGRLVHELAVDYPSLEEVRIAAIEGPGWCR
jgi:hypothetical protein